MLWGHLYYDESLIGDSVSVSLLIRPTNTKHTTVLVGIYANVLFKIKNIYSPNFPGSDVYEYESSVGQCSADQCSGYWRYGGAQ